jgi:arsenate reductase
MTTIYGIANCDTMKKARKWLSDNGLEVEFHDYKKLGVDEKHLDQWLGQVGWEVLLNRRGMMWRKLDDKTRDNIDAASARKLMLEIPSIIKRPVLVQDGGEIIVGFNADDYQQQLL